MIDPAAFMDDQERLLREGEEIDDDILRGASPSQAVFWLCGMLGATLRILPGNTMAEEKWLAWEVLEQIRLEHDSPWFQKYMEFAETLVNRANGRFPVSHGTLIGPSDLFAVFRGHTQCLMDLIEEPEKSQKILWRFGKIFQEITEEVWKRLPRFCGGYFDAQYQLWTENPIIRMQEDAIAVYSPKLYRTLVQPVDQYLAQFGGSFMHRIRPPCFCWMRCLKSRDLHCFEVNYEVGSGGGYSRYDALFSEISGGAARALLIRGSFTPDELRYLVDSLDHADSIFTSWCKTCKKLRPCARLSECESNGS